MNATAQRVHQEHSTVVTISEQALALSIAATIYGDCRKEEQRLLREHQRLVEEEQLIIDRLNKCRADQRFYGRLIGME